MDNLILWEQRINERILSGMTIEEWCKNNKITKHKYLYWNHLIREKKKSENEMTFAEITPILSNADEDTFLNSGSTKVADFQISFKGINVTVPTNFNPHSLTELMKVIQKL